MSRPAGRTAGKQPQSRRQSRWSRLYAGFVAVALCLLALEILLAKIPFIEARISQLDELQRRRLDIYLDLTKLLITGSGLTIGAITGFVLNRDKTVRLTRVHLRKIVWSWGLAAVSLYCGYFSIQQVVWMLGAGFFDLNIPHIWLPSRLQFLSLLAAITVFADFIHSSLKREDTHEKRHG